MFNWPLSRAHSNAMFPIFDRFSNPAEEIALDYDVVPPLDDDVQLSVNEYRRKLYEVKYAFCTLELAQVIL